ncbi:flagellin [Bacillus sp. 1P06AnD]|uniref:flagellin N-terminal helical domain-containing protein n=1 Tax=Bacillus sp. 1P06AnD TaxID=3132208 RepID=UPI0039A33347
MIINHNIAALNTYRQMGNAQNAQSKNMEKLSSGMRINRAGDDAAGLAISEKMRGQIRGLDMASKNSQDGISLIQTAEGALNETHSILQRMRELATQAANDTNTESDRGEIQKEINSLTSEINRIGNTTEFNTQKLLNGSKDTRTAAKEAVEAVDAVKGVYKFDASTLTGDVSIGGVDFTHSATTADGKFSDIDELMDLAKASSLGQTYDITKDGTDLVLTEKVASGQTDAPTNTTEDTASVKAVAAEEAVKAGAELKFQIGANQNQSMSIEIADMRASALGITGNGANFTGTATVNNGTDATNNENALDVSTHEKAANAITVIQSAIDAVSAERSKLGASQNRLEHTINNLSTSSENLSAAESRIRDVDMAKEMMEQTKNNILQQASQAMLAQANQQPQGVLQLLK